MARILLNHTDIIIKALKSPKVQSFIKGKEIERIIYVPDKLINIVTKK